MVKIRLSGKEKLHERFFCVLFHLKQPQNKETGEESFQTLVNAAVVINKTSIYDLDGLFLCRIFLWGAKRTSVRGELNTFTRDKHFLEDELSISTFFYLFWTL